MRRAHLQLNSKGSSSKLHAHTCMIIHTCMHICTWSSKFTQSVYTLHILTCIILRLNLVIISFFVWCVLQLGWLHFLCSSGSLFSLALGTFTTSCCARQASSSMQESNPVTSRCQRRCETPNTPTPHLILRPRLQPRPSSSLQKTDKPISLLPPSSASWRRWCH